MARASQNKLKVLGGQLVGKYSILYLCEKYREIFSTGNVLHFDGT
jgi:hypothetical protein